MPDQPRAVEGASESTTHNEPQTQENQPVPKGKTSAVPANAAVTGFEGTNPEDEELEAQLAYENLKRKRAAKKRKRLIVVGVVVLVALVGAILFVMNQANSASEESETNELVTSAAYAGDFSTTITANGATEPLSSTVVTPEVDGIIENLQVEEGKQVKEGDVLFTLKNEDLDKEIRDAANALTAAERATKSANNAVDDAYAAYNKAVEEYNNSGGEGEFDEASLRSAITSAEDTYQTALEAEESAREKVEEAQKKADKRTVRAPVSGTIVSMSAKNGMGVGSAAGASGSSGSSSGALMQISDLSQMKVTVQVNEVDIASIKEGQEAKATFSALPDLELAAKVVRIASASTGSGESEGAAGSGGVVTYAVGLVIPKPDKALKPGMTANVTITTQSMPNSIIVPSSAVQDGVQGKYVTVVTDEEKKETKEVPVEVVMENSSEAAIKGDVKDGDIVVIGGGSAAEMGADSILSDEELAEIAG